MVAGTLPFVVYLDVSVSVGVTSPFTKGRVKLAPSFPAVAPTTSVELALGPRVTVLVHPVTNSVIAAISVTSVFMCFLLKIIF